jgi:hypothetical protein
MDIIEKTAGAPLEELREHDWQRGESAGDYFWWPANAARGSWRLAAGLVLDSLLVRDAWKKVSRSLRHSL